MAADPRVIEFIKKHLSAGKDIDEIEKRLIKEGWNENSVEEAIDEVIATSKVGPPTESFPRIALVPPPLPPIAPAPKKDASAGDIFSSANTPFQMPAAPANVKPATRTPGMPIGFLLAVIGGTMIISGMIVPAVNSAAQPLQDILLSIFDFTSIIGDATLIQMMVGAILIVASIAYFFKRKAGVLFGALMLIFSLMGLFSVGGLFFGSLLGIIGGITAILKL